MKPPDPQCDRAPLVPPGGVRGEEPTGLPGLATWPRIYGFVVIVFVIAVGLLTGVTLLFS